MERQFWQSRWDSGQIGFHEGKPNDLLVAHVERLAPKSRVLVPLAGKSADLFWLADRGHEVVGVEFVMNAIEALFDERGFDRSAIRTKLGKHDAWSANRVTMICSDILNVSPDDLGRFDAVYDRGALVALEPASRARYVDVCRSLLSDSGTTLLIAVEYDQSKVMGPPWSVDERTVRELFANETVERLEARSSSIPPRHAAAGVTKLDDVAYAIRR